MARIPLRLSGPTQITNAAVTQFTVPAGSKYVVRHVHVENPSGSAVTFTLSLGTDAAGKRIYDAFSIPAAAAGVTANVVDHYCYYVMEATEIMQAFAGTTAVLVLTINGDNIVLG